MNTAAWILVLTWGRRRSCSLAGGGMAYWPIYRGGSLLLAAPLLLEHLLCSSLRQCWRLLHLEGRLTPLLLLLSLQVLVLLQLRQPWRRRLHLPVVLLLLLLLQGIVVLLRLRVDWLAGGWGRRRPPRGAAAARGWRNWRRGPCEGHRAAQLP